MAYGLENAVEQVGRWVSLHASVILVGDDGSGKTSVLRAIAAEQRRKATAIFLSASPATPPRPFAALSQHPLAGTKFSPASIEQAFLTELDQAGAYLLVDDLDLLDPDSTALIGSILRRSGAALIASTNQAHLETLETHHRELMSHLAPSEVRLEPLGYAALGRILTDHLGAAPDAALLSSVVSRSAGNLRAALAIIDAARWSGSVQRESSVWSETGSLDDAPLEAVAYALTGRLAFEERDALMLLAWAGPLDVSEVDTLVAAGVVRRLAARGRLVSFTDVQREVITVSPPALAKALREQLTAIQRAQFAALMRDTFRDEHVHRSAVNSPLEQLVPDDDPESESYGKFVAKITTLALERAAAQDGILWSRWRSKPTAANAVALLEHSVGHQSARDLRAVFTKTMIDPSTDDELVERFRLFHVHWTANVDGQDLAVSLSQQYAVACPRLAPIFEFLAGGVRTSLQDVGGEQPMVPGPASAWFTVLKASVLIEVGQFERARDLIADVDRAHLTNHVRSFLEPLHGDALLFANELDSLERNSRQSLHDAYDHLDMARIRVHAFGLAQVFFFTNHLTAAWQIITSILRLGPDGPFDTGYRRRFLYLAVVVRLRMGDSKTVDMLRQELQDNHSALSAPFSMLSVWVQSQQLFIDGADAEANHMLWARGADSMTKGRFGVAAMLWSARTEQLKPDQADRVRELVKVLPDNIFTPYLKLQLTLLTPREDVIIGVLRAGRLMAAPRVAAVAITKLHEVRDASGEPRLTEDQLAQLIGPIPPLMNRTSLPGDDDRDKPLTDREREVALYARNGLSNQQIARTLTLSTRTVENHIYRTLRKLGLANRSELASRWSPSEF